KGLMWSGVDGSLAVRAPLRDLERVAFLIARLPTAPPQLNINVKLLELTPEAARRIRKWAGEGAFTSILNADEAARKLREVQTIPGVKLLSEGNITTLTGRNATMQWGEMQMAVRTTTT